MIGTQIPILLALCEYGFVLHLKKTTKNAEDQVETMDQNDSGQTLDEKIKKLDYASLVFTLLYFIIFVSISAHEDRRHRCHLCGKGFIYPHKLQEHLNTHTGDKPFKCKFCNAAFASSSNKRMHERAHLGIKVKQSKKQQQ